VDYDGLLNVVVDGHEYVYAPFALAVHRGNDGGGHILAAVRTDIGHIELINDEKSMRVASFKEAVRLVRISLSLSLSLTLYLSFLFLLK